MIGRSRGKVLTAGLTAGCTFVYVFTAGLLFHFHSFYFWLLSTCIFFVHLDCPIIAVTIFVVPVLDVIIFGDILS